jgi:hypothetical protein
MTSVTSGAEHITRYRWTVPCGTFRPLPSAVIGEVLTAYDMAKSAADSLAINTRCDDWLHVSPADDEIVLWFDTSRTIKMPTDAVFVTVPEVGHKADHECDSDRYRQLAVALERNTTDPFGSNSKEAVIGLLRNVATALETAGR